MQCEVSMRRDGPTSRSLVSVPEGLREPRRQKYSVTHRSLSTTHVCHSPDDAGSNVPDGGSRAQSDGLLTSPSLLRVGYMCSRFTLMNVFTGCA